MAESAEATVKSAAHAAMDGFEDVVEAIAEYGAPILGLVVGWAVGSKVGGVWTVGNLINNVVNPKNVSSYYQYENIAAGLIVGGIEATVGGYLWSSSGRFGSKGWGSLIGKFMLRFLSGMLFGMALNAVIAGITNNPGDGWLDNIGSEAATAAAGGV